MDLLRRPDPAARRVDPQMTAFTASSSAYWRISSMISVDCVMIPLISTMAILSPKEKGLSARSSADEKESGEKDNQEDDDHSQTHPDPFSLHGTPRAISNSKLKNQN